MIWNVIAKRGLGINVTAGSKTNINDQIEDFIVPSECSILSTNEAIYPNPAKNEFFINFPATMLEKVSVEIYDMAGK